MGPSSENSYPNYGLGDFKESIGCKVSMKYSFSKGYKNSQGSMKIENKQV